MSERLTWQQRWERDGTRWRYIYELERALEQYPAVQRLLLLSVCLNVAAGIALIFCGTN